MRPTQEETWLEVAKIVAKRGTCSRRQVGCVIVDAQFRLLSSGYNGPPAGEPHCIDHPCPGATLKSGQGLSICEAVHAEENALLQCKDPLRIQTVYVTTAPCVDCVKLLMNTACRNIVFLEDYPQAEAAKERWLRDHARGRTWQQYAQA